MSEENEDMKNEYDFSKGKPSRFVKLLKNEKQQITIRLDLKTVAYFKCMAEDKDISYQNLINLYLRNCVEERRELKMSWDRSNLFGKQSKPPAPLNASRYIGVTEVNGKLVGFSNENPLEEQIRRERGPQETQDEGSGIAEDLDNDQRYENGYHLRGGVEEIVKEGNNGYRADTEKTSEAATKAIAPPNQVKEGPAKP